jgi:hypothetical protein
MPTLESIADADLRDISIGKLSPPENVTVVSKKRTFFSGMAALSTQVGYVEKGTQRIEETIYVIRGRAVYRLQLQCDASDRPLYESAFHMVLKTVSWECSHTAG